MAWPWRGKRQPRALISISDPALATLFQLGNPNFSGVIVSEQTALGVSPLFRAVSLVSGTIAGLPLRTYRDEDGRRVRIASWLDDPGAIVDMTPFEWKQTIIIHQLLHGDAFLAHIYNRAGAIIGAAPIHPLAVAIDPPPRPQGTDRPPVEQAFVKTFRVSLIDGTTRTFTQRDMTHLPALSTDGRRGISLLDIARNSLGTTIAADRAAAKLFNSGALMSGIVTPEEGETVSEDDMKRIKKNLDRSVAGWDNAAEIAAINRRLKFQAWTISAEDLQFIQGRQFQVEEVSRWTGVPPHLLMQTEKQTSWGTGVAEQNRGLSRFVLGPWTMRLEQRLSRLLPRPRFVEFDFAGLERPDPEREIDLLIRQAGGPIITVNEARAIRNLPPIEGGDQLAGRQAVPALPPGGVDSDDA